MNEESITKQFDGANSDPLSYDDIKKASNIYGIEVFRSKHLPPDTGVLVSRPKIFNLRLGVAVQDWRPILVMGASPVIKPMWKWEYFILCRDIHVRILEAIFGVDWDMVVFIQEA